MLNHKSTRSARLFWLGALLGAAVFLLVYGLAPLDVANDAFCRGGYIEKDIQQHYAGWLFYRSSAPGWPLGVTQAINAPQGVSVAYTDSIPLLAVLCRPLAAALGGTFQYFGWFTLVCFALQGGFAALLCGLFAEGLAAPLAGSLVFAASPILLERAFRHTSLGAQWLVLAALYCYFVCRRQSRFASRGLFVINILAVGIHPYFLPMTYAVTLALLLEYAVKQRQWLRPALFLGGNMLCTAALGWALGLLYGSDEAIAFAVEVQKTLAVEAYRASVRMAAQRGAFPIYDASKEKNNPMIARIREADPELYAEMEKTGRRNIAMLTIAPTGTTSLMSQTTSGIEPVFRTVYKRRRKINPSDHDTHVDYEDETGEKFQEYNVYHHNFVKWLDANGYDTSKLETISDAELNEWVAASPYHGATANDIDWVAKVKMQGAIQKWVDHSISVTVNLPNNVSEALVADVYRTAWECGCKGVTVYRDGCRDGVLLDKASKNKKKKCEGHPGEVAKRPKSIPADIVRFKNGTEDWIAFVGLQDGRPYEVFTGKIEEDAMYIPRKINKGFIIKVREDDGTKRYDFQYTDRYGYTNTIGGISRLFDEEFWNYAKLISGVLRHGMPIEKTVSLIESLHLDSESINTWKTGVCRALKQYIVDGTKSKGKCPSCGQENMAYQNGCLTCMSCGYSKCG